MGTVSLVQGPAVVSRDEGPALHGQAERTRVPLDVRDGSSDLVRMIQEDLPSSAGQPRWVVDRTVVGRAEASTARFFQGLDHLLCGMLVLANQNVNVVWHDRASVAGISPLLDHLAEGQADLGAGTLVEGEQGMLEETGGVLVEPANLITGRLHGLASEVKIPEFGKKVG